jgi:hypothetical protein
MISRVTYYYFWFLSLCIIGTSFAFSSYNFHQQISGREAGAMNVKKKGIDDSPPKEKKLFFANVVGENNSTGAAGAVAAGGSIAGKSLSLVPSLVFSMEFV